MINVTPLPPPPRGKPRPEGVRRQAAIDATRKRFEGKAFTLGHNDCLQLVRYHLRQMGHSVPKPPRYSTAFAAKKALASEGVGSLEALLDKYLTRIPPAAMLPGDVGLIDGEDSNGTAMEGATLVIGVGAKLWGWHADLGELAVLVPLPGAIRAAWRA